MCDKYEEDVDPSLLWWRGSGGNEGCTYGWARQPGWRVAGSVSKVCLPWTSLNKHKQCYSCKGGHQVPSAKRISHFTLTNPGAPGPIFLAGPHTVSLRKFNSGPHKLSIKMEKVPPGYPRCLQKCLCFPDAAYCLCCSGWQKD